MGAGYQGQPDRTRSYAKRHGCVSGVEGMNLNAAALLLMAEKGLSLTDVAEIVAANEAKADTTATERQRRCRANKKSGNVSHRDVTRDPPIDNTHTPQDYPIEAKASIAPRGRKPKTSHRLPDDWQPEPLTGETAIMVSAWEPGRIERELAKFRDYWKAASGRNAVKDDWQAALRFWLRNSDERGTNNGKSKQSRNSNDSMGVTERAARQAMHEISGGTGSFADSRGEIPASDIAGSHRIIDAVPDAMRSIGYAGSG